MRTDEPLPLRIEVRGGREIIRQGDAVSGAWLVASGALLMEALDPEGRRLGLDVLGPGDLVGGVPGGEADATVRALTTSSLVPAGPAELREGLARRARRASWLACSLAWHRIAERLALRMEDLAARFGRPVPGGVDLRLRLRQEDLASLTGATRESVNRALAELATTGRVRGSRGGYVLRPPPEGGVTPHPGASPGSTSRRTGTDR